MKNDHFPSEQEALNARYLNRKGYRGYYSMTLMTLPPVLRQQAVREGRREANRLPWLNFLRALTIGLVIAELSTGSRHVDGRGMLLLLLSVMVLAFTVLTLWIYNRRVDIAARRLLAAQREVELYAGSVWGSPPSSDAPHP